LAAGLTLPQLRHRWGWQRQAQGRSGASRFTASERDLLYRHAGSRPPRRRNRSGAAPGMIRARPPMRPGRRRRSMSQRTRCTTRRSETRRTPTAGRLARSMGRVPRRTVDGERLRAVARLLALAGDLSGDSTVLAGALLASLAGLAVAVAELRQAQQHAAQAAAARKAAEHMHAAMARARSSVPWPAQTARPQPPRSASHTTSPWLPRTLARLGLFRIRPRRQAHPPQGQRPDQDGSQGQAPAPPRRTA
jgi:hypothetical protein